MKQWVIFSLMAMGAVVPASAGGELHGGSWGQFKGTGWYQIYSHDCLRRIPSYCVLDLVAGPFGSEAGCKQVRVPDNFKGASCVYADAMYLLKNGQNFPAPDDWGG